jgi:hypothetical protein
VTLKERVEENVTVWLLGSLLSGFLAGIATFRTVQEIGGLEPISKSEYQELQRKVSDEGAHVEKLQSQLEKTTNDLTVAQKTLIAQRPQKAIAVHSAPVENRAPEFEGVRLEIVFTKTSLASTAREMASKVESLGFRTTVTLFEMPDSNDDRYVGYYDKRYLPAAAKVAQVLKSYGIREPRLYGASDRTKDDVYVLVDR